MLYVVDSVTRKWLDQAKSQGQAVNGSAQDGTFAAGVHRVTELMPVLMNDIIQSAPDDQKVSSILGLAIDHVEISAGTKGTGLAPCRVAQCLCVSTCDSHLRSL